MFNNTDFRTSFPLAFRHYKPRSKKTSGVIVVSDQGNILLVKGRERNKWSFPKGHIKGTESIHQCALRECFEETGLFLYSDSYVGTCKLYSGEYYIYRDVKEVELTTNDTKEICDIAWVSIPEMFNLRTNIDVSTFLKVFQTII